MNISDSDKAMDQLKWSTLQNRRESHIFKFVKKCIKSHCPQFFKNYFTFNKVIHNRRLGKATCFICQEFEQKLLNAPFIIMVVKFLIDSILNIFIMYL